jgi:uncharacterized protein YbjT (DUF2867 family)
MTDFLIYGATGYTGSLIADEAVRRGYRPILAGRNAEVLAALARKLERGRSIRGPLRFEVRGQSLPVGSIGLRNSPSSAAPILFLQRHSQPQQACRL